MTDEGNPRWALRPFASFFAEHAPDINIEVLETSTATVQLAADAHGVTPGQIAKTLAFKVGEKPLLIVASGDARIDNRKIRDTFGGKAKMLDAETVMELTSHPVGGVCPLASPPTCRCTAMNRYTLLMKCCPPQARPPAPCV
ncbi:hypothetical protein HORIV_61500 [Vreelandella olivaria]|uniref:YbaK/aminoacyl-tRNA synthetase-associated domain-containing protein n=1 Tax=Vreelandella olivaria TaxID=390919 RepID=A0ABN5X382_9GAMM|nr:hypothetical protein HORIV_61500 [Halomonas olivaria]